MATTFELGQAVTWLTPQEKKYWDNKYRDLLSRFGPGPFIIEAIVKAPLIPHPQHLVLRASNGVIEDSRKAPVLFSGSWLKPAE